MKEVLSCTNCGKSMESGTLLLGVKVGLLNFLGGVSGSAASLIWKPEAGGQSVAIKGKKKKIPAHRCQHCGNVVFRMPQS